MLYSEAAEIPAQSYPKFRLSDTDLDTRFNFTGLVKHKVNEFTAFKRADIKCAKRRHYI